MEENPEVNERYILAKTDRDKKAESKKKIEQYISTKRDEMFRAHYSGQNSAQTCSFHVSHLIAKFPKDFPRFLRLVNKYFVDLKWDEHKGLLPKQGRTTDLIGPGRTHSEDLRKEKRPILP